MIALTESYKTRPIRFIELWEIGAWKIKVYGISYSTQRPAEELVLAARGVTEDRLSTCAEKTHHYGVGFTGIHQGRTGNFVFVDWWADENELHHHVYVSATERPADMKYMTPTGLAACAWDLFLIGQERDAWVTHVLKKTPKPDLEGYLASTFNGDI